MKLKTLLGLLAFLSMALPAHSQSKNGQLTILTSTLPSGAESDLEFMVKASSCKWDEGPSSLDPKKLDREVRNFLNIPSEGTKRICQGRISCDVGGIKMKSHRDIACGMKADNCDAYQCFKAYLEARVALQKEFAKEDALKRKDRTEKDQMPVISRENKGQGGRD